ncbi:hypothetical protein INT45_004820, partial [Circinella minor]
MVLRERSCPFKACHGKKPFKKRSGLFSHIRTCHPHQPIPAFGAARTIDGSDPFINNDDVERVTHNVPNTTGISSSSSGYDNIYEKENNNDNNFEHDDNYDDDDNFEYDYGNSFDYDYNSSNNLSTNSDHIDSPNQIDPQSENMQTQFYTEDIIGASIIPVAYGLSKNSGPTLSKGELAIAKVGIEGCLSNRLYKSMSEAAEYIAEEAQETGLPFRNCFTAWNELQMHLTKIHTNMNGTMTFQPFKSKVLEVETIPDFPYDKIDDFKKAIPVVTLVYRDIAQLSQKIFSHPLFADAMNLQPTSATRGGERVYTDVHTSEWWH